MKKVVWILIGFLIVAFSLPPFLLKEMRPWSPPFNQGFKGSFQKNNFLKNRILGLKGLIKGPEDVAIDSLGRVYVGLEDGGVIRHDPKDNKREVIVNTGGRPLGLHFDKSGHLIIADAKKGLLKLDPETRELKLLFDRYKNHFVPFLDDVTVGKEGVLFFTQASEKYSFDEFSKDFIYHKGTGKVFSYNPESKNVKLLMKDLHFANGIAISPHNDFLLIVETGKYRVLKYFLKGPKMGKTEVFIDNLPGFPDGISSNGKGLFWMALIDPRDALLDKLLPLPNLRKVLLLLPHFMDPPRPKYGAVFGLNSVGQVVFNFQDPEGAFFPAITSAQQFGDKLYLGSLRNDYYGWVPLPSLEKNEGK